MRKVISVAFQGRGIGLSQSCPGDNQNNLRLSCQAESQLLRFGEGRRGNMASGMRDCKASGNVVIKGKGLRDECLGCE